MAGQRKRFFFTLAPLDLPFEIPFEAGEKAKEAVLYQLLNLSWYFRRRIVDELYDRVLQVSAMSHPDRAVVNKLFDEIRYELINVSAQSIFRGIDNPLALERAFGGDDPEAQALLERLGSWRDLRDRIFKSIEKGAKGLPDIADDMHEMAMQNHEFYRKVTARYSAVVLEISAPPPPHRARLKGH